jgi:hypothetical protein
LLREVEMVVVIVRFGHDDDSDGGYHNDEFLSRKEVEREEVETKKENAYMLMPGWV